MRFGLGRIRRPNIIIPSYPWVNEEAEYLVSKMEVEPDDDRKSNIDDQFTAIKALAFLSLMDGWYFPAAHTAQASVLNWADPDNYPFTGGGTFVANAGWTGNITIPNILGKSSPNLTQNSACVGFYRHDDTLVANATFISATNLLFGLDVGPTNKRFQLSSGTVSTTAVSNANGNTASMLHGVRRSSSATQQVFGTNASSTASVNGSVNSTAKPSGTITISSGTPIKGIIVASNRNNSQLLALRNAFNDYVGRL